MPAQERGTQCFATQKERRNVEPRSLTMIRIVAVVQGAPLSPTSSSLSRLPSWWLPGCLLRPATAPATIVVGSLSLSLSLCVCVCVCVCVCLCVCL